MKRKARSIIAFFVILLSILVISSCSPADKKTALNVIIIPKIEIDEMSGDFPGEAQLFSLFRLYFPPASLTVLTHTLYLSDAAAGAPTTVRWVM